MDATWNELARRNSAIFAARIAEPRPGIHLRGHERPLVPLPKDTRGTSVCLWQGDRWQCLVDLWTDQEGRSDLVLDVDVFEDGGGYRYAVKLVYVP